MEVQQYLAVSVPAGFIAPYADDTVVSVGYLETTIGGKKCPEANQSSRNRNDGANTSESQ